MKPSRIYGRTHVRMITLICLIVIGLTVTFAVLAPWLAPHDPLKVNLKLKLHPPNEGYPLGMDHLGRCIFSRLVYGARVSLTAALSAMTITLALSFVLGSLAGYMGGVIDATIMRLCDVFLAFPKMIIAMVLVAFLGNGLLNVVIALVVSEWAWYSRIIRGMILSLREREYVLAATVCGTTRPRIIVRHFLPGVVAQLVVLATMDLGGIILYVSALSFLGLGIQPPTPEWGAMISDASRYFRSKPELMVYPGLMILLVVMSFNFLGDVFRDYLDPGHNSLPLSDA